MHVAATYAFAINILSGPSLMRTTQARSFANIYTWARTWRIRTTCTLVPQVHVHKHIWTSITNRQRHIDPFKQQLSLFRQWNFQDDPAWERLEDTVFSYKEKWLRWRKTVIIYSLLCLTVSAMLCCQKVFVCQKECRFWGNVFWLTNNNSGILNLGIFCPGILNERM